MELHIPKEYTVWHGTEKPENSYTPFPTRTDFEQAEVFINHNCLDKLINSQLKLARKNGMHLKVKSLRKMHKLLAHSVGENANNSKVCFFHPTANCCTPHRIPFSFGRRRSQSHTSEVNLRRTRHTWFTTIPQWMQCFV